MCESGSKQTEKAFVAVDAKETVCEAEKL